jgi:hypothetical protein
MCLKLRELSDSAHSAARKSLKIRHGAQEAAAMRNPDETVIRAQAASIVDGRAVSGPAVGFL